MDNQELNIAAKDYDASFAPDNIFKDIFGDKLFGSQLTNENNIPEFQYDIDKISDGYDTEERYISDKYFATDECKSVLKWMNKKLKNKI